MRKYLGIALVGAMVAFGAGCSDDDPPATGTGGSGGSGGTGGGGPCGDVEITDEEITVDTAWDDPTCTYILTREVYVVGATLTIGAGVTVAGDNGSALVVTTSGMIDAQGTAADPIVFTSSRAEGQRLTGDWGGVVLLGEARLSWGNAECDGALGECVANIEGLPDTEDRGQFGGNDDAHNCGTIEYARIEFAGFRFGADNELNGLTVGGCGSATTLDYIQVHRGLDDGVEFFGGTSSISHVIVSGTGDDGIDWDQGYNGVIENFIVHHFAGSSDDPRGIEADNFSQNNDVEPRSAPQVMYGTIVASPDTTNQQGMVLRRGTWGTVDGVVVSGWDRAGVDIRDASWELTGGWPTGLAVTNSCFDANDPNYPPLGTDCDNPDENLRMGDCNDPEDVPAAQTFDEATEMAAAARGNLEEDPGLGDFSGAIDGSSTPDYSITNANCMGAFATMGADNGTDWTEGWTAFPAD
ncbi:MAG: hypothetical protein HKN10_19945 [Myxococcales bacterium]|nr:hypothetical protein [Myxococcales bacterium]